MLHDILEFAEPHNYFGMSEHALQETIKKIQQSDMMFAVKPTYPNICDLFL